jgi:endonuclease-3
MKRKPKSEIRLPKTERRKPKTKFAIEKAMPRLRAAVAPYPKAALFELAAEGHNSVFEILVACIISIRTRDETTFAGRAGAVRPIAHAG